MKYSLSLLILLSSVFVFKVNAQSQKLNTINGNETIEKLRNGRYTFNKNLIKSRNVATANLPKSEYIFNKPGVYSVVFDDIKFVLSDNEVKSINGIQPSEKALEIITERLTALDRLQFIYSQKSNEEYLNSKPNLNDIVNLDRQFFSVLKIMGTTVKSIAVLSKEKTPSVSFELGLAKLRKPNINEALLNEDSRSSSILLAKEK